MKLKIHIIIAIAVAMLNACQLLRKDKSTLKKLSQTEELQVVSQKTTLSVQNQLVLIDSSHNDFTMMLWPKGKFKFSIAKGFEGEAEKILIRGKQTQQKILKVKTEKRQDSIVLKANYSNKKESSTVVKKNKFSIGYNWAWIFIFPILYLCYWLYKRYKLLIG